MDVRKVRCPECQGKLVSPSGGQGEIVCASCGLVVSEVQYNHGFTEFAPEWFSTWDQGDSGTLKKWLTELRIVTCQLHLPDFPYREEAARVIRKRNETIFHSQKLSKNKKEAVTALIYLILRQYGEARSLKEICEQLSLDPSLVMKHTWKFRKMTKLKRFYSPIEHLRYNGWKLTADAELIKSTAAILKILRTKITGNPVSLAAGAFYHMVKRKGLNLSKEEIGKAFHISGRTVYSNEKRISNIL